MLNFAPFEPSLVEAELIVLCFISRAILPRAPNAQRDNTGICDYCTTAIVNPMRWQEMVHYSIAQFILKKPFDEALIDCPTS